MAVDPSIALGVQSQPVPNMLAQYGQLAQTGNALLQGRQLQQTLAAQQAQGAAIQSAIRPDGTYDTNAANSALAAAGPAAAPGIQAALAGNQSLAVSQQARGQSGQQQVNQTLTSLLTLPDAQMNGDTIRQSINALAQNQAISPADAQGAEAQLPPDGSPPAAYRQYLTRHTVANLAGPQAVQQIWGAGGVQDKGGQLVPFVQASPMMGGAVTQTAGTMQKTLPPTLLNTGGGTVPLVNGRAAGPAIPNTPTPGDQNALTPVWDPAKRAFTYQPRAAVAPMVDGSGTPTPTSMVPGLPTSGRVTPGTQPAPPAATNIQSPSPGTGATMEGAAAHYVAANADANNYQQRITPLQKAETALETADTGRASETLNNIRSYVQALTPEFLQRSLPTDLTDPNKVAAYDEAHKYLTAAALSAPGGTRSNEGQAAAQASNASTAISPIAAKAVVRAAIGQMRMTQAGTLAFSQQVQTGQAQPADYDTFMQKWNTQQDPRGYIADKMTPQERAGVVKSLGGVGSPAYQQFKNSYQQGVQTGVVPAAAPNG